MGTILYKVKQQKGGKANSTAKNKYYARPLRVSTITVDELNDLVAADSQVERAEVAQVTDAIFKQVKELVLNGHSIKVGTLGTLTVNMKAQSQAKAEDVSAKTIKSVGIRLIESKYVKMPLKATRIERAGVIVRGGE